MKTRTFGRAESLGNALLSTIIIVTSIIAIAPIL
jgi:hypothetical protein